MPTHPTPRTVRHPYLVTVLVTLGLIIVLATVGTASALNGLTGYAPLAVAFVPLAIGLAVWATVGRRWSALGFAAIRGRHRLVAVLVPLALPVTVAVGIRQLVPHSVEGWVGYLALAMLVGFVEETIFRGALLRMLCAARGRTAAVVGSSVSFALAHAAAAINPDQSKAASLRQIVFALLFGLLAAQIVLLTHSLLSTIALHAVFDLLGFVGVQADPVVGDVAVIIVAAVVAATFIKLGQGGSLPRSRS